jgi:hypothetical protein
VNVHESPLEIWAVFVARTTSSAEPDSPSEKISGLTAK